MLWAASAWGQWQNPGLWCSAPGYLQPGPSIAVGQGALEDGRHIFNGNVNGIILLELHLTLLDGQIIDLDAKNDQKKKKIVPCGHFL